MGESHNNWQYEHERATSELTNAIVEEESAYEHAQYAMHSLEERNHELTMLKENLAEQEHNRLVAAEEVQNMENIVEDHARMHEEAVSKHEEAKERKYAMEEQMGAVAREVETAINHMNEM